ncbi:FAD:protein FMN transferase [candidate division WOR-3 bacterium]|nr:FAD:protein FMN transferase [candidate division WOR-3 bacterium]
MNFKKIIFFVSLVAIFSCSKNSREIFREETSFICMDTKIKIVVTGQDRETLKNCLQKASQKLSLFDSLFGPENRFLIDSPLDPLSVYLWEKSCEMNNATEGAFDPALGEVSALWGDFDAGDIKIPDRSLLDSLIEVRKLCFPNVENGLLVYTQWMKPDLGGIAKGLAVRTAAEICDSLGAEGILVEAGGDICALGFREDKKPWKIGVLHPRKPNELVAVLSLKNLSVCTSGDYERYAVKDGVRYHHVLNPFTLSPSEGIASATVVCEKAEEADAYSTAFMILPLEKSMNIAKEKNLDILLAVLSDTTLEFICSPGFERHVIKWNCPHREFRP